MAETSAQRWEGSAFLGSTLWPGLYLRCWAGANMGQRALAPPAQLTGGPRQ